PICSIPPMMMMPEMAFVTDMSGVCNAGVTFQITCHPTKTASTNTVKCCRNDGGALVPNPIRTSAATAIHVACADLDMLLVPFLPCLPCADCACTAAVG